MQGQSKISNLPSAIELGSGQWLHFAHANGYPPRAYMPLLEMLAERYHVIAQPARPLWPGAEPHGLRDWRALADDFVRFLEDGAFDPIIGVGHSLGAVTTLMAAVRRPLLFRAVVMIDPVIFVQPFLWAWRLVKALGLGWRLNPLIRGALKRRTHFASAEAMFTRYRRAPIFSRMDDRALRAYVESLARPCPDGTVELAYSPEWEARIYFTGFSDVWDEMRDLRVPLLLIYGAQSDTFSPRALAAMRRVLPNATYQRIEDAGHLVPLEKPGEVANTILDFLKPET